MKTKIITLVVVAVLMIGGIYFFNKKPSTVATENISSGPTLSLDEKKISLLVVDTDEERMKGLGGMDGLPENTAMLFVFDKPGLYSIWMKDMKFPIDIIWLDENKQIVHIEKEISPETYPAIFSPTEEASFILETKSGFSDEHALEIGKNLEFSL